MEKPTETAEQLVSVSGTVVTGDRRGSELGFPTANVSLEGKEDELPPDGVYAGWFTGDDGVRRLATVSIGTRPTYYGEGGERLLEAHLLDFAGDLYGQQVTVEVGRRVRGQERFESSEELVDQIARDVATVRGWAGA